jgi:hypothetical protein
MPSPIVHSYWYRPYALACMDAYYAYGGDQYVQKTSSLWTQIQANQVTEMNAAYGSHNRVNFQPECVGRTSPCCSYLCARINCLRTTRIRCRCHSRCLVQRTNCGCIYARYDVSDAPEALFIWTGLTQDAVPGTLSGRPSHRANLPRSTDMCPDYLHS